MPEGRAPTIEFGPFTQTKQDHAITSHGAETTLVAISILYIYPVVRTR